MITKQEEQKDWLIARRTIDPMTGCWNWIKGKNSAGYGVDTRGAKTKIVSRVAYSLWVSPIPDGLCVLHRCDNPSCFNPEHLFVGTKAENMADMVKKGRCGSRSLNRAKLQAADVLQIRALWKNREETQRQIADRFRISCQQVSKIVNNTRWRVAF